MTRRALLAVIVAAVHPRPVAADLEGTERLHRANRRCAILGRAYARHGITSREQTRLTAAHCQEVDGQWVTDRIFTA